MELRLEALNLTAFVQEFVERFSANGDDRHPLVLDLFLQLLDDASLTLATGERRNVAGFYVVMTLIASLALALIGRWAFRVKARVF